MGHIFIFSPGLWIGEGRIKFSASSEFIRFYTRWTIAAPIEGIILCQQAVEMQDQIQTLINSYCFSAMKESSFELSLSNEVIDHAFGTGLVNPKTIAWEFRQLDFDGFEVYELQDNGDYLFHAEFVSSHEFRTIIDGRLWLKS